MNEIKLNRDQADKMIEKIDYLDSSNLIYAHKMREAVESLVECEHQYILGVCRLCGHRNDVAEPSYKKRDREYWEDVYDKSSKLLIGDVEITRIETDEEIARGMILEYADKNPGLSAPDLQALNRCNLWLARKE